MRLSEIYRPAVIASGRALKTLQNTPCIHAVLRITRRYRGGRPRAATRARGGLWMAPRSFIKGIYLAARTLDAAFRGGTREIRPIGRAGDSV